jgi:hypothetical protein
MKTLLKQDLKKEEFYSFISQMEGLNYFGDVQDRKFFHRCLYKHILATPVQSKRNLNSYFKSGSNRLKMMHALHFIQDYMPSDLRLYLDRQEGIFWTDWRICYEK